MHNCRSDAEQLHLLAEPPPLEPAGAPDAAGPNDPAVTDTTKDVPVLYHCPVCARAKLHQVFRVTLTRRIVRRSWWNPSVCKQVTLTNITWTTPDGQTLSGEHPPPVRCRTCRSQTSGTPVRGRYNPRQTCGAKCIYAKGPDCECSCAGANHGAGYSR